jgi:hypothetical protein
MWIAIGLAVCFLLLVIFYLLRRFNTYVLIARNLTWIYQILQNEFKDRFPNEETLLTTCGVIDTSSYNFPLEDIKLAVKRAQKNECFLNNLIDNPTRRNTILSFTNDPFLSFVVEIEIMIFLRDSSFRQEDIATAVVSVTQKIQKAINRTKRSYESGKRPSLWHRAVTNFMASEAAQDVRNEIGIINPTPEQQLDRLFKELIKREHWKNIDPEIIKTIFENAKGDVDSTRKFILISELHNSVENNFVKIASDTSKEFVLNMFALTLYRLGSDLTKVMYSAKNDEEMTSLGTRATMAFMSSILCEPSYLTSYFALAVLYSNVDVNIALEWCAKYKQTADTLMNTPDEELSAAELSNKESLDPEKLKSAVEEMAKHTRGLVPQGWEEDVAKSMSDKINELETELLQKA